MVWWVRRHGLLAVLQLWLRSRKKNRTHIHSKKLIPALCYLLMRVECLLFFCGSSVTCMNDLPQGNFPDYNHNKLGNRPGQMWSADEQCRVLLRDRSALAVLDDLSVILYCCNQNLPAFLMLTICRESVTRWDAGHQTVTAIILLAQLFPEQCVAVLWWIWSILE